MLADGGLTPLQAIRSATMNGAFYLGLEKEIGSIEEGKLADFLVLEGNPLIDLSNIATIKYTIANGRLYDSMTMQETITGNKSRLPFYFESEFGNNDFHFHEETGCFQGHSCGCRK
jgi:cytosine/adenosine deaminase-related metal-dependent hydrolase